MSVKQRTLLQHRQGRHPVTYIARFDLATCRNVLGVLGVLCMPHPVDRDASDGENGGGTPCVDQSREPALDYTKRPVMTFLGSRREDVVSVGAGKITARGSLDGH